MNDFTQEELILIACWSGSRYQELGNDQCKEEGTITLSHKIQDMIVNYCDHHWIENQHHQEHCSLCGVNR